MQATQRAMLLLIDVTYNHRNTLDIYGIIDSLWLSYDI